MTIRVRSRVMYVGACRPDWHGIPATVESIGNFINLRFDRPHSGNCYHGTGVELKDLKEIGDMIDPNRPVQTTEAEPRVARTIGVLERVVGVKTLLIAVPMAYTANRFEEIEISLDGRVVNGVRGSALTFVNTPKIESGFYPVRPKRQGFYGRGQTSLASCKSDYSDAEAYVEVIYTDGKATGVQFHGR